MTTAISDIASVIHHGGKHTVTGSCHELKLPRCSILNDCGLFQGKTSIWATAGHHWISSFQLNTSKH